MPFLPALAGSSRFIRGPWARLHAGYSGPEGDKVRLTFVFSRELVEACEWQGGERFVVSIGTEADLGGFQIVRCGKPNMGLKLISNSNARGFRLGITLPREVHGVRPAELCRRMSLPAALTFEVDKGTLTLRATLDAEAQKLVTPFPRALP